MGVKKMHVIEFKGNFQLKRSKNSIIDTLNDSYFKKSMYKAEKPKSKISTYQKKVKEGWTSLNPKIREIICERNLLIFDKINGCRYFIFKDQFDSMIANADITLNVLIISDDDSMEESIQRVCNRIKDIIKNQLKFDISLTTKCKAYIYDEISNDIHSKDFITEIHINKRNIIKETKYNISKVIIFFILFICFLLYYNNSVSKFFDHYIKLKGDIRISTDISIAVNIVTSLAITFIIELFSLIIEIVLKLRDRKFKLTLEPNIAINNFNNTITKSTLGRTGEGIDNNIPSIPMEL